MLQPTEPSSQGEQSFCSGSAKVSDEQCGSPRALQLLAGCAEIPGGVTAAGGARRMEEERVSSPEIKARSQSLALLTAALSQGWSCLRNARYVGLSPLGRCSRRDPDVKSEGESRSVISSQEQLILPVNIVLRFGKLAPAPSFRICQSIRFTMAPAFQIPLRGLSLAVPTVCQAQDRGQQQSAFLGYCVFEWKILY